MRTRASLRKCLTLGVFAFLLVLSVPHAGAAFKYLHEGMNAPDFEGKDFLTGKNVKLRPLLDSGMVVIAFWSTWSERSLEELADLKGMAEQYREAAVSFVAINVDKETLIEQDRQRIRSILDSLALPFPVILDDGLEIFYSFGVIAVPSTAVLDREGILKYGPAGYSYTTRDRIVDSIEVLSGIRERPVIVELKEGYHPDPRSSRFYRLALQMNRQGLIERALEHADSAIDADSGFAAPLTLRGELLLALDSNSAALQSFEQAMALDSLMMATRTGYGIALMANGQIEEAHSVLSTTVALDDTYTPAMVALAGCLVSKDQHAEATTVAEKALELDPYHPEALLLLGQIRRASGDLAGGIEAYLTALDRLFPAK